MRDISSSHDRLTYTIPAVHQTRNDHKQGVVPFTGLGKIYNISACWDYKLKVRRRRSVHTHMWCPIHTSNDLHQQKVGNRGCPLANYLTWYSVPGTRSWIWSQSLHSILNIHERSSRYRYNTKSTFVDLCLASGEHNAENFWTFVTGWSWCFVIEFEWLL
jgi:hypothetical protein